MGGGGEGAPQGDLHQYGCEEMTRQRRRTDNQEPGSDLTPWSWSWSWSSVEERKSTVKKFICVRKSCRDGGAGETTSWSAMKNGWRRRGEEMEEAPWDGSASLILVL